MADFSSFIPQDRRRALVEGRSLDGETTGTALLADISGFTPLSEEYSQEFGAHRGAEEVTLRLNTFFDLMVQTINTYGGAVISFSGDALTCWFDHDEGFRALTCALEIQKTFQAFPTLKTPGGREFELGVKVALANGPARRFLVGEPEIQMMDLMAGDVFQRMARIEQRLEKGEVGTDQQVSAILPELASEWPIRRTEAGEFMVIFPPGTDLDLGLEVQDSPSLPEVSEADARAWLLGPVFDRIQAGQNGFLADLRIAVVFFLGMESPDFDRRPEAVPAFQQLISFLQKTLADYEGNLLQVIVGDKGTYLYGAFGAPVAHENEAGLALHALLTIRDRAGQAGLGKFRIGVSQGQIYAGAYGGSTRKTYGVLGNEVNIAARIMQAAPENGILVSPAVYRSSSHQFRFEAVGSKTLKGLAFPMELQKLKEALPKGEVQAPRDRTRWPLVGREVEMDRVEVHLNFLTEGQGGLLLVEGEAGIGKSRFIDEVEYRCRVRGATVFRSGADYIEANTPYFVWRAAVEALLQMDAHDSESAGAESLAETQARHPDLAAHFPLLGTVLALPLEENETTASLAGESRAELTHHLLTTLWQRHSAQAGQPLAFILEDAHWFDEASWRLLNAVLRDLPDAFLVVTTRPLGPGTVPGFDALAGRPGVDHLPLGPLAPEAAVRVVKSRLAVTDLPEALEAFLTQRGEGNPFYSLELALALVDTGLLAIRDGKAVMTQKFKGWQNLPFPDTLQGAIASRVDRLPTDSQGILKVAAVIGRNFLQRTIEGVVGDPSANVADLTLPLDALRKAGLILEQEGVALPSYEFQHAVIQRVTYDLLLHQQRLDLHRRVAQWYEAQYGDGAVSFAAVVGYHWREAGDFAKAVGYFRHAGLVSLKNFANHEAISLLDEALKLDNALPAPSLDRKTRAEIDLALGEAYLQAIRDKEAIEHFEKGLEGLGYPIPRNLGHLAGAILVSLARRLSLGSARGVCSAVAPADTPALTAVGSTLITLTEIYGGSNKLPQAMYSTLVGTRWAEKLGLPTETARGLAYCSVIFDFLGMKGQAAQLVARAEALLETAPASRNRMLTDLAVGFFHAGRGQLDDAFRDFDRLGRDAATFGDHHRHRDSLNMQIMTLTYAGRFAEALDWSQDLIGSSQRYGDPSMLCVARSEALLSALILGKPEAKVLKSLLERDVTDVPADLHRHQGYVVLGLADVADGHWDDAVARADQVVAFLQARATALVTEYYLSALPAEIYSRAWEQTGDTARFAPKMARALMTLDRYATSYPLGRPVLRWAQGRASALAGRPQRAVGFWRRGLAEAEGKDLAWAEGRLALALAGSPRLPVPQRRVYAQRAWALFERRGIGPALLECNSLLGGLKE